MPAFGQLARVPGGKYRLFGIDPVAPPSRRGGRQSGGIAGECRDFVVRVPSDSFCKCPSTEFNKVVLLSCIRLVVCTTTTLVLCHLLDHVIYLCVSMCTFLSRPIYLYIYQRILFIYTYSIVVLYSCCMAIVYCSYELESVYIHTYLY